MRQDILVLHQTLFQIGIQLYQKTFFQINQTKCQKDFTEHDKSET